MRLCTWSHQICTKLSCRSPYTNTLHFIAIVPSDCRSIGCVANSRKCDVALSPQSVHARARPDPSRVVRARNQRKPPSLPHTHRTTATREFWPMVDEKRIHARLGRLSGRDMLLGQTMTSCPTKLKAMEMVVAEEQFASSWTGKIGRFTVSEMRR